MPKFIIYEERIEVYSCTIEADSIEHAKKLYDEDPEEVFGDQWEHESTSQVELGHIIELDENGNTDLTHVFENGELMDSF